MHYSVLNPYGEGQQPPMWEDDVLPLNVLGGTLRQTLLDEIQTEVMHLVKLLCLEQFTIIHYLSEIIHTLPHKIFVGRSNLKP